MKKTITHGRSFVTAFILVFSIAGMLYAQRVPRQRAQEEGAAGDTFDQDQKAKMDKERREESFQKLKEDSEKLYQATGELKEMIEKSNQHTFSLQILKKTDEIERILKEVKRRAKEGPQ
jgi:hypothetical protein